MADQLKNTVDARHIYFTSLLSDSRRSLPGTSNTTAQDDITRYDEYLNSVLNHHLEKRCKIAAFESMKNISRQRNRTGEERDFKWIEKSITYSALRKREFDNLIQSIDENDEWLEKESELRDRFLKVTDRNQSEQTMKKIMELRKKSTKIEDVSRNLLVGAGIDFLQDDDACRILFQE